MERVQRCMDMADDARRQAGQTNGVARNAYLIIAEQWERLATDAARQQAAEKSDATSNVQNGDGAPYGRQF
jgi:hypothetical protein